MKIVFGNHTLKAFSYNIYKISHSDLIKLKLKFIEEVCNEYPDISKKQLLLAFADADNDMLEYYKTQCPNACKIINGGVLIKTSHPERT